MNLTKLVCIIARLNSEQNKCRSETINQSVYTHCQDKLQNSLSVMYSDGFSGLTSLPQSFLGIILSFAPWVCTSRKGGQLNKRSQYVKYTTLDMQSGPWSPHAVSAQILAISSAWWRDFCVKNETICPVFQSHSRVACFFRRFLPRKTFHKHSSVSSCYLCLLTVSCIRHSEVEMQHFEVQKAW